MTDWSEVNKYLDGIDGKNAGLPDLKKYKEMLNPFLNSYRFSIQKLAQKAVSPEQQKALIDCDKNLVEIAARYEKAVDEVVNAFYSDVINIYGRFVDDMLAGSLSRNEKHQTISQSVDLCIDLIPDAPEHVKDQIREYANEAIRRLNE